MIHGTLPAGEATLTLRLAGVHRVRPGERLPSRLVREQIHLFDPTDGRRLN